MTALLTDKQIAVMDEVFKGDETGAFIDIETLMKRLGHTASKQAMQCSIRFLESHGLVTRSYELRRCRRRMVIAPTMEAFNLLRGKPAGAEELIKI
jgi:hypothetical protein